MKQGQLVTKRHAAKLTQNNWADRVIIILLVIWSGIVIYPFYNSFLISIVPPTVYYHNSFLLYPPELDFTAYKFVLNWRSLQDGFRTTAILVLLGVPLNLFLTTSLAYILTRPIPGRKFFNFMIIFTMFFEGGLIPGYLLIQSLGLMDNIFVMILPMAISIMNMIIMRSYFYTIPDDLAEAARIDGAGEYRIMFRIYIPLSKPMLATIGLYYGVARWNEWYNGMLFMRTSSKLPLQLHIRNMLQSTNQIINQVPAEARPRVFPEGIEMAAIVLTILPIALVYPFLQKYFVKGLTLGGVKS